uniref:Uncharacterized protein LOC104236412 n=1 Tax=Nicotiana sylvestris TaxID=4096 RepID=A0A1U7XQ49_NICSY|nr:PREDICTED: uncharacterized protein LOC104236412 [Nicotiana sylvestris]
MDNHELITIFLEAQEPDYFQNMMSAIGRPFAEAIKIGEMVENGLKTGRIISQAAIKATTQAIQTGSGGIGTSSKGPRPQQQNFRALYNARPRQDYGREQRPVEKFTPLAALYSSLFRKLKQMGVIGPNSPHHMHPDSHGFQANARCEYHSGAPGHNTDDCWTLKRAIERLITEKLIVVTNGEEHPNVTNNPLPAHNDVQYVGMIGRDLECRTFNRAEMTVGTIQEGTKWDVSPIQDVPLFLKGAPSSENVTLFVPKVTRLEVRSNVPSPRLYVLGGHPITRQKQGSTNGITEPIIIKPTMQPPVTNTKTIPWNYNKPLRKTPSQISLLSLLLHSKEHARVLIKTLNEAHVSEKTTVNELEKMANRFFEENRISFTDDELPEEGARHNRALHLINTDRIRPNNVRIRAFDDSSRDTIGEINLTMTIGPIDFEIVFQVVDMDTSYKFLIGRPWIHMARAVPSTLHQMVKFEHNRQEIIVHGEDESSIYKDPLILCIEAKEGCESIVYQAFEVVSVDHVE